MIVGALAAGATCRLRLQSCMTVHRHVFAAQIACLIAE
jgi:hypothetical protein